ncbi:MAG: hypothetical protein AB7V77_03600 [Candidatus Woesearchaeota archaeon]
MSNALTDDYYQRKLKELEARISPSTKFKSKLNSASPSVVVNYGGGLYVDLLEEDGDQSYLIKDMVYEADPNSNHYDPTKLKVKEEVELFIFDFRIKDALKSFTKYKIDDKLYLIPMMFVNEMIPIQNTLNLTRDLRHSFVEDIEERIKFEDEVVELITTQKYNSLKHSKS